MEDLPFAEYVSYVLVFSQLTRFADVQLLLLLHFVAKIGFQANDAVTSLKLVEKGMSEADLALAVLIDFPCQLVGGYYAAKWANTDKPLRPWYYAFWARLFFAAVSMAFVYFLPKPPLSTGVFVLFIILNILSSFSGCVVCSSDSAARWSNAARSQDDPVCGRDCVPYQNC